MHRTFVEVDVNVNEIGTRAGAATIAEMKSDTSFPRERKEVCLNRPFIYMIIDREAKLPLFIGTKME